MALLDTFPSRVSLNLKTCLIFVHMLLATFLENMIHDLSWLTSWSGMPLNMSRIFITHFIYLWVASLINNKSSPNIKCEIQGPFSPLRMTIQSLTFAASMMKCVNFSIHKTKRYNDIGSPWRITHCGLKYSFFICSTSHLFRFHICLDTCNIMHNYIHYVIWELNFLKHSLDEFPTNFVICLWEIDFEDKVCFATLHVMHHLFDYYNILVDISPWNKSDLISKNKFWDTIF